MMAFALALPGCMAPMATPPATSQARTSDRTASPKELQPGVGGESSDLAGVLEKLAEVRAIDPAAEQQLVEELRRTPAESWPLVAEQFRASLAYREQLAAKTSRQPPASTARASESESGRSGTLVGGGVGDESANGAKIQSTYVATQAPVDDRSSDDFASDGPANPVGTSPATATVNTSPERDRAIQRTVYEANDDPEKHSTAWEPPTEEPDWQTLVAQAAAKLSSQVAASPSTTDEVHQHASLRLLRLLEGETERALEPIPNISPTEQDYWSRQLFALATYLDHHSQPDDKRRAAASVLHLDEAVSHLRELGSLSLRNLSFCKSVYGYGAIEPYGEDRFSPGDEVSLYVEIENYHSESTEAGFCTLLGSSYELLDEDGDRVAGGDFPDVDDCCRTRRRDFHIQYGLVMPQKLAPGRYRVKVVVKDRQSDKMGSATAEFEIGGSAPAARPESPSS